MMKFKKSRKGFTALSMVLALIICSFEIASAFAATSSPIDVEKLSVLEYEAQTNSTFVPLANEIQEQATQTMSSDVEQVEIADTSNDNLGLMGSSLLRATVTINWSISANSTTTGSTSMSMESGESITINVSYSPSSASLDVGILQPDGSFRYVNSTSGSVNHTFSITERGVYKVRIRNNSSNLVSVTGFVNY
jgi:hypothetical protein